MKTIAVLLIFLSVMPRAMATSMAMKRGPSCQIVRQADRHDDDNIVHLFLMPPKATQNYKPGKITLYLTTSLGTINVPLALERQTDGRLYVRFYVKRIEQELYYLNVVDEQEPERLWLYGGKLSGIQMNRTP